MAATIESETRTRRHRIREAIEAARLDVDPSAVRLLQATSLAETFLVSGAESVVLKLHPIDLRPRLLGDPDPRFATIARLLPVSPFFAATEDVLGRVRSVLAEAVPRVLAEGRLHDDAVYTWMTHVEGRSCDEAMLLGPGRRPLSSRLGRLARALHRAPVPDAEDLPWSEAFAEAMHGTLDHLPGAIAGGVRDRFRLHAQAHRVAMRIGRTPLGRRVLAHCDLHPSNLLFDRHGEICGIVDFQLACPGPASLDFRWLCLLDADAFLAGYGAEPDREDGATWLGHCVDLLWTVVGMAIMHRHVRTRADAAFWVPRGRQMHYLLSLLGSDRLRRGPEPCRLAARRRAERLCHQRIRAMPVTP